MANCLAMQRPMTMVLSQARIERRDMRFRGFIRNSGIGTLSGADLTEAAARAGAVETALAGGANTIVISVTTLLLILIIVILLAS